MPSINEVYENLSENRLLHRLLPLAALGLAVGLLLTIDPHWYWPGLAVSAAGLVLHLWTIGSVRSRKLLPVNGPYKFMRHPTYITRFVLILGLVMMTGEPTHLLIYVPLYVLFTIMGVSHDEQLLEEKFEAKYLRYSRQIPRFLPSLKPYEEGRLWFFNLKSFRRQYGEIILVVFPVFYALCYVVAFHLE